MKTNTQKKRVVRRTHEGAPSPVLGAAKELRRTVMAHMLFEDTFYDSGVDAAQRIADLVPKVSFEDAAQITTDAREKMKLRHVPLFLLREMVRIHKGRQMGDLIHRVIQRADEPGELLALYWKDGKKPLANQLKIGLARALKKFNEYQLAKYNRDGGVKLRDVLFMTHARPHISEEAHQHGVPAIRRKDYHRGAVVRHPGSLWEKLTEKTLATPDTWEVSLSEGADKKETFQRLLTENKLGALALLRNLRNMIEAGVPEDMIRTGLMAMRTERVLPFRFITAAKYAPRLEDALEAAMFRCLAEQPKLPGKTALLIDHSGSMHGAKVSAKSEIDRFDAACALAMVLRESAERCRVFCFSAGCVEVPPRRGFALIQAAKECMPFEGTYLGQAVAHVYSAFPECERLIVITDEQSADRPVHPRGKGYIVNVAGYQQGIAYGPWIAIDGWSEAILSYIAAYEEEENALR